MPAFTTASVTFRSPAALMWMVVMGLFWMGRVSFVSSVVGTVGVWRADCSSPAPALWVSLYSPKPQAASSTTTSAMVSRIRRTWA